MTAELKQQLEQAIKHRLKCKETLEALSEWQFLQEANQLVSQLETEIRTEEKRLKKESEERSKQEIIDAGFEVRTGHTTGSTNHRDWQSDDGEPWTFLIVHSSRPQVKHVSESSRGESISTIDGSDFNEEWLLGHGETEEEAWEDAIENWVDSETKELALQLCNH
jgi:hypothetical protein